MGLRGQERAGNLLPGAYKPAPSHSLTQMCSRSAELASEVAMYVLEYISKPSREALLPPHLFSPIVFFFFFSFSDTPRLMVPWSTGVDRGVCPLISKHSQGAYGEKAC